MDQAHGRTADARGELKTKIMQAESVKAMAGSRLIGQLVNFF